MAKDRVEVDIIANSKGATQGTEKFASSLKGAAMQAVGMTTALGVAAGAVYKLNKFTKESIAAASAAQEVHGKYSVVFQEVEASSRKMADALANDFDIASSSAEELLGNTGDLLTGFGLAAEEALTLSDQTNRLAIDLASFSNAAGGAEAVSKALTSAYSGEREALKTYGIVMTDAMVQARMLEQTQQGLNFESEQQAKIYATLAIAQEQSKNAIGDYARTAESAANVQRTLSEQIKQSKEIYGSYVLEGLTPVKAAFRDLLKEVNRSITANQRLKEIIDDANSTGADYASQIERQEKRLKLLKIANVALGGTTQALVDAQQRLVDALKDEVSARAIGDDYAAQAAQRQQEAAEILIAAADEEKKIADQKLEDLEKLQEAYAQTDEGTRAALEAQIAFFEGYKDGPMAQAVLEDLRAQYAELITDQAENEDSLWSKRTDWIENWRQSQIRAAEATKQQAEEIESSYANAFNFAGNALSSFTQALAEGENGWTAFAKVGLDALASILTGLGHELAAIAAKSIASSWFTGGISLSGAGPALAGSLAAYAAAGTVRGLGNNFKSGGEFTVPEGYRDDSYMVGVSSGEKVTVENEDQAANGTMMAPLNINIDATPVYRGMIKATRNGIALIDSRAVVKT